MFNRLRRLYRTIKSHVMYGHLRNKRWAIHWNLYHNQTWGPRRLVIISYPQVNLLGVVRGISQYKWEQKMYSPFHTTPSPYPRQVTFNTKYDQTVYPARERALAALLKEPFPPGGPKP